MPPDPLRTDPPVPTGLILAIYAAALGFIAAATLVFLNITGARPGAGGVGSPCAFTEQCPLGQACVEGTCRLESALPECSEGDACDGHCACADPRLCDREAVCRTPTIPSPECSDPAIAELLQKIARFHAGCAAKSGGGNMTSCPASDVRQFVIEQAQFDEILQRFPGATLLLFPNGQPALPELRGEQSAGTTWPDEQTRAHYLERLRLVEPRLREANRILLIGRASGGNTATNFAYAQERVRVARNLLRDLYDPAPEERRALEERFMSFALGPEPELSAQFFAEHQYSRFVAASAEAQRLLAQALTQLRSGKPRNAAKVQREINRSVMIVPVPCDMPTTP